MKQVFGKLTGKYTLTLLGKEGLGKKRLAKEFKPIVQIQDGTFIWVNPEHKDYLYQLITPFLNSRYDDIIKKYVADFLAFIPNLHKHPYVLEKKFEGLKPSIENRKAFWEAVIQFLEEATNLNPCTIYWDGPVNSPFTKLLLGYQKEKGRILFIFPAITRDQITTDLSVMIDHQLLLKPMKKNDIKEYILSILSAVKGIDKLTEMTYAKSKGNLDSIRRILLEFLNKDILTQTASGWLFKSKQAESEDLTESYIIDKITRELSIYEKQLLLYFSISTKNLPYSLLEKIVPSENTLATSLTHLLSNNMIREEPQFPNEGYLIFSKSVKDKIISITSENDSKKYRLELAQTIAEWDESGEWAGEIATHYFKGGNEKQALKWAEAAGEYARKTYNYEDAVYYYSLYTSILKKNKDKTALIKPLKIIGLMQKNIGDFPQARKSYLEASNIALELKENLQLADIYNDIGVTFFEEGAPEDSLNYYNRALELETNMEYTKGIMRTLNNLGSVDFHLHKWEEARQHFEKSLELAYESNHIKMQAILLLNLGEVYLELNDFEKAHQYLVKSANLAREHNSYPFLFTNLININELYLKQGKMDFAHRAITEAEEIFGKIATTRYFFELTKQKARFLITIGQIETAYNCLDNFITKAKFSTESQQQQIKLQKCLAALEEEDFEKLNNFVQNLQPHPDVPEIEPYLVLFNGILQFKNNDIQAATKSINDAQAKFDNIGNKDGWGLSTIHQTEIYLDAGKLHKANSNIEKMSKEYSHCLRIIGIVKYQEAKLAHLQKEWERFDLAVKECQEIFKTIGNKLWQNKISLIGDKMEKSDKEKIGKKTEKLFEVIKAINSTLQIDELLTMILEKFLEVSSTERGFLLLKDNGDLQLKVAMDASGNELKGEAAKYSHTIAGEVFRSGVAKIAESIPSDDGLSMQQSIIDLELKVALCVPIKVKDENTGVIYADARFGTTTFSEEDLKILTALADQAGIALENAKAYTKLKEDNIYLKRELKGRFGVDNVIIGQSPPMLDLYNKLEVIASQDVTVILLGETGVGKDLIAKALHYNSDRNEAPFVALNCAAVPETLLESELFGYVKGAFTGAVKDKKGKFEVADGGTIFLDEIGDLSPPLQAKLLRVIEDHTFQRVGGVDNITVDVRILAATNKDLTRLMETGEFREDLYYRISTVRIDIPPLRERREDIPALVEYFISKCNQKFNKQITSIHPEVMEILQVFHWPGNIRQLENAIEEIALFTSGNTINFSDLPGYLQHKERVHPITPSKKQYQIPGDIEQLKEIKKQIGDEYEKAMIEKLLKTNDWNIKRAAEKFGMNRCRLHHLIKKYDLK